jgi:hypothetical protein
VAVTSDILYPAGTDAAALTREMASSAAALYTNLRIGGMQNATVKSISPLQVFCTISKRGECSKTHWSGGVANLAEPLRHRAPMAATTTPMVSPCGWQVVV